MRASAGLRGLVILLAGECAVGALFDGFLEDASHKDIRFWSSRDPSAFVPEGTAGCAKMTLDGKPGRSARVLSEAEGDRMRSLHTPYTRGHIDGTDIAVEGTWAWSDGAVFYRDGFCTQAHCAWGVDQPDNANDEDHLELFADNRWNDVPADFQEVFYCEFPCRSHADCEGPLHCTPQGRCAEDGTAYTALSGGNWSLGADIDFWVSNESMSSLAEADRNCGSMFRGGRQGRPAMVLSAAEEARLVAANPQSKSIGIGGRYSASADQWQWPDGSPVSSGTFCLQSYCGYFNPGGKNVFSYIKIRRPGLWVGANLEEVDLACEFPCVTDADCTAPGHMCHWQGRCVVKAKAACAAYAKTAFSTGYMSEGDDLMFWLSTTVEWGSLARFRCAEMCYDGRRGRGSRIKSDSEYDRIAALLQDNNLQWAYLAGANDVAKEGTFYWDTDEKPMSIKLPNGENDCRQHDCYWEGDQPDNAGNENYLLMWNHHTAGVLLNDYLDNQVIYVCEFPCTRDADCKNSSYICDGQGRCTMKDQCANYGKVLLSEGVLETSADDIAFWHSGAAAVASRGDHVDRCADLCYHGRKGRPLRALTSQDANRVAQFTGARMDGYPSVNQALWKWMDGTPFYDGASSTQNVVPGCLQDHCAWPTGQAFDAALPSTHIAINPDGEWLPSASVTPSSFLCEFPCVSDEDCNDGADPAGLSRVCHSQGRCVVQSNCSGVGDEILSAGKWSIAATDIRFWASESKHVHTDNVDAFCAGLCHDGRAGRLARITSESEQQRVSNLGVAGGLIDGNDLTEDGVWMYSDGTVFWTERQNCLQEYCNWLPTRPLTQSPSLSYLSMTPTGPWTDVSAGTYPFYCEFPCIGDADCNGEDVLCPPYKCTALGRCVVNPKCFKTTDCKYLRLEDACSANERCEWVDVPNQMGTCASKPCRQATKDACTAVATCEWSTACASDACMEKRCTSDLRDVCVTDERCAWEDPLQPDDCERAVCGEYASEGCCRRQPHCEWNTAASPAFCKEERCRAEHKTAADCSADESCIWQDGACEKVECPGTNECDCKRAKGCIWDEGAKTCASEAFVLCPAVDVVVLLDGSSTMAMSFGRHPHGFFALVETLRDWIEQLPLTGTKAGVAATAQTPGMRVGFVQYASLHNLPVASVAAAALGGTGGSVSGDAGQLSADLDWHEDNFINGASKVEKGLALAKQLFDATLQTSPRVKVIYIISDGPAKDSEAVSAANGAGTPLGDLRTDDVDVFGILIRRTAATTPADTAALGSLKLLLSADVDDHAAALEMHALADSVLYRICDPTGPFGDALAAKTNEPAVAGKHKPCFVYAESHACSLDSGCAWDGVERECVDSVCVRICDAGACALAPGHLCEWSAGDGCVKATVCALTDKAACEASPQKCSWAAAACRKTPCVSVGSELACATDPDDCTWWTINGAAHCIETPCKGLTPAACEADSLCAWTTVDPCDPQAGSSCQLAGCILYRNRTECLADSRCMLDPDDQCQNDPCFEYADELCCDRRAECAWNTSTSPASCRLGPCYAVGTEPACEADEACMWAAAAGGCVDLDCRAFGAQCACNQRPGCFWKNSRVPECTAAKYGVCPTMDVVVVFDGSLNMNQQFGRHPAGFVAVIEALRTWASELPLSSESASIGDESPRATELVRLAFVQAVSVASPSDAVSGVAVAPATGGRLSGNRTELHADLDWHEDVQGPGMAAGFTPALRKANRVFERDVPMADETRRRVLLVVSGGSFDASLADAEVDNLELLGVERFGIALRRAETATAADKAATASLGKLVSPLTDQHVVSALVDELPGILGSICDPNAAWGSIVITEQSRVSPDQHLPCVHHLRETPCKADHGCAWDPAAAACRNSPCLAVCGAAACPEVAAANCTWGGVFCIETPANDCECDFGGLERSVAEHLCGDVRTCRWNATSGSCRRDVCGAGSTARATCANNGQTCVEAGSGDSLCPSWSCDCVAPQALVQQPLEQAATCVLSECATQCASCVAAAGCGEHQVCKDPDISPSALNDWSCECLPPYSGAALGRSAACRIDECAVECPHCANGTCSAAMFNQTCVDPDHATMGDWRCVCPYPANQSGLAMAAPSCDVDECLFYGGVCAGAEQTCVDGSLFELDNWRCVCPPPAVGTGVKAVAVCRIYECEANCSTCAGGLCGESAVAQTCRDPDPSDTSLGDWVCVCPDNETTAVAAVANCALDECADPCESCANATCVDAGQNCTDPIPFSNFLADWSCACPFPSNASATAAAVPSCDFDECWHHAAFCAAAAANQSCWDPDASVAGDWRCVCDAPALGSAPAGFAACAIDECEAACATCEQGACAAGPVAQACSDPDHDSLVLSDWTCTCPFSNATAVGTPANCDFDECTEICPGCAKGACAASGQVCRDPAPKSYSLGDWTCSCPFPAPYRSVAGPVGDCSFDECTVHNATCTDAGQDCEDAELGAGGGDWRCVCRAPLAGNATAEPSECTVDECEAECATCEDNACLSDHVALQHCVEPNSSALSLSDWLCRCPASVVTALGGAANCPLDECVESCDTCPKGACADANQTCHDPFPGSKTLGDWTCVCGAPSDLTAVAGPVDNCSLDECLLHGKTCAAAGQTCVDENARVEGDWRCDCVTPLVGSAVKGAAACSIDECAAVCPTCANVTCSEGAVVQVCKDPNHGEFTLLDWFCTCPLPPTKVAVANAADCPFDECEETCAACALGACAAANQSCRDPNPTSQSLSDWTCTCAPPASQSSVGSPAASCAYDECTVHTFTCSFANQGCHDPDQSAAGDWMCTCKQPLQGNASQSAAACSIDECVANCVTCDTSGVCAEGGQACEDPNTSSLSLADWRCVCAAPSVGSAAMAVSHCVIDECEAECAHCEGDICDHQEQACRDPNTTAASASDWTCTCKSGLSGSSVASVATCVFDECAVTANEESCAKHGQSCVDPDTSPAKRNDWECRCVVPPALNESSAVMKPATCEYPGECNNDTEALKCQQLGYMCNDPNPHPSSLDDWVCMCTPPLKGEAQTASASGMACEIDECENVCSTCAATPSSPANACAVEGQACNDPDHKKFADWVCACPAPSEMTAVGKASAECLVDECAADCATCEGGACSAANQQCADPDTNVTSLSDWTCSCVPPGVGAATAGPAACVCDECAGGSVCTRAGQACRDDNTTCHGGAAPDFVCGCNPPYYGEAVGLPVAVCRRDECAEHSTCTAAGQTCSDPDDGTDDDWRCECPPPSAGSAVAALAGCVLDECVSACATCANETCTGAGQVCSDPDSNASSTRDWTCRCTGAGVGVATGKAATCACDECAATDVCASAGQTCEDRNLTCRSAGEPADYSCVCGAPMGGVGVGEAAVCVLDECDGENSSVCAGVGQDCEDPDPTVTGDWACVCRGPAVGVAAGRPAACTLDECAAACAHCANGTCADAGQTCNDTNTDAASTLDWTCACAFPGVGAATARVAPCVCNECLSDHTCADAGQFCYDGNRTCGTEPTFECKCPLGWTGHAVAGVASCEQDECDAAARNGSGICAERGQACSDPDRTAGDTWLCVCPSPARGTAAMQPALCVLDECVEACAQCAGDACEAAGQACNDPDQAPDSTGDWTCTCRAGVGEATAGPAACVCDECVASTVCAAHGQECSDKNTTCASAGEPADFTCTCPPPAFGSAVGAAAVCSVDECEAYGSVCTTVGQACTDEDLTAANTWRCVCAAPGVGSAALEAANCTLDECAAACPHCENGTCTLQGQACVDADTRASAIGDWTCECQGRGVGIATGRAAACSCDDCAWTDVCAAANQTCFDGNSTCGDALDFVCLCEEPYSGNATGAAAACSEDECLAGDRRAICEDAGQTCRDPNASSPGDWECHCPPGAAAGGDGEPGNGAPVAKCVLDECEASCPSCAGAACSGAGQTCADRDTDMRSLRDWVCKCSPPSAAESDLGPVSSCTFDECAGNPCTVDCAPGTAECSQTCIDPDTDVGSLNDWSCACPPPSTDTAIGAPAVCAVHPCTLYANEALCLQDALSRCAWVNGTCVVFKASEEPCAQRSVAACESSTGAGRCSVVAGECAMNPAHGACPAGGCCACLQGWTGADCGVCAFGAAAGGECPVCTRQGTCGGRGSCTPARVCLCDPGWGGVSCGERACSPAGAAHWYTLYPNEPVEGRPFNLVVHGCFDGPLAVKLLPGDAECQREVKAPCATGGDTLRLDDECHDGAQSAGPRVEVAGLELLLKATAAFSEASRAFKLCWAKTGGNWTELSTHARNGDRTPSFRVSSVPGKDSGSVSAAPSKSDSLAGCCEGLSVGSGCVPVAAVVAVWAVFLSVIIAAGFGVAASHMQLAALVSAGVVFDFDIEDTPSADNSSGDPKDATASSAAKLGYKADAFDADKSCKLLSNASDSSADNLNSSRSGDAASTGQ